MGKINKDLYDKTRNDRKRLSADHIFDLPGFGSFDILNTYRQINGVSINFYIHIYLNIY